ncbi:MAG: TIGR01777 family oxidoreductase, partial [Microbacteriaceae bacterium]
DPALLEGIDALVHLAGASIAGRFTPAHKHAIRDSRIAPTRLLCELAAKMRSGPRIIAVASAIGYYGADRGDEVLTEDSAPGESFLANVVADWEAATRPAAEAGIRVTNVRTGIVQSPRGGTLRLFRPLFSLGLGGRISTGAQWLSWIDIDDLVDVYNRALFDRELSGPVNAVAPHAVRNSDYARTLARILKRPALFPVPSLGPELLLGAEGSHELAEADQNVMPTKLQQAGHRFRRADLEGALRHQLGRERR